jgi:tRNA modification GTPase
LRDWLSHPTAPPDEDTIVAVSTAPGEGALAVVRLSGSRAIEIGGRLFDGRVRLQQAPPRTVHLGFVRHPETGDSLDQVMALVMRGPRTFTGEDVVEFSGHGGNIAPRLILEAAVDGGARPASPGEFSRRAFLNGRIDLAQAEAVAELIHARGERAFRNALHQLNGGLSRRVEAAGARILDVLAPLEAFIDFGDDVPEAPNASEIRSGMDDARMEIQRLLEGETRARQMTDGATVALIGPPNVGKSSLLNAISGRDRALVHDMPGTTRDTIDVEISIDGIPVRLVDTAGIRRTPDPVERAGVERARQALESADLSLVVIDASSPPGGEEHALLEMTRDHRRLLVRNKIDLGDDPACRRLAADSNTASCAVSALSGLGIGDLLQHVSREVVMNGTQEEVITMTRARHYVSLRKSLSSLNAAEQSFQGGAYADMVAAELREAMSALGEITGRGVGPDILDRIFSSFCIGK